MEAARKIRDAVAHVSQLRQALEDHPALGAAVGQVKRVQSRRFAGTYSDLLAGGPYAAPALFFLTELYSDKDYAERDAQFSRIAGAIEKFFPQQVVTTAVALAELHALTEELDQAMALVWLAQEGDETSDARRYALAWREVGRREDREGQLTVVLRIGEEMARRPGGAEQFLRIIETRESALLKLLFDTALVACETSLARTLGQAP